MPAFASHHIFAQPFAENVPCKEAFFIGAQGPDVFFFHRPLGKSRRGVGSALHRAMPSDIFDTMVQYINSTENYDIAYSYALGFVYHYALDTVAHPYVYSLQEKLIAANCRLKPFTVHNDIEHCIDSVVINHVAGLEEPCSFNCGTLYELPQHVAAEIGAMLAFVAQNVLGVELPPSEATRALHSTLSSQMLLYDKTGAKKRTIATVENAFYPLLRGYRISIMVRQTDLNKCWQYANMSGDEWTSPFSGESSTASFFDLFSLASVKAQAMVQSFNTCLQNGVSMAAFIDNTSFLTGVNDFENNKQP